MKRRTVKFAAFFILMGLGFSAYVSNAQGINVNHQELCGVPDNMESSAHMLPEGYLPICTDPAQIKYIRVAIHFLLPGKLVRRDIPDCVEGGSLTRYIGWGNFTEFGDGFANSDYNGYRRAEDIIHQANAELEDNADQWRKANDPAVQDPPLNITYPAVPPEVKVRYLLTGVYFHRDEAAYYLWKTRQQIHVQYGVSPATTINVYYTPELGWSGVANSVGGSSKFIFSSDYFTYIKPSCRNWSLTYSGSVLNHEIGHVLGLQHTWDRNDDCADTPQGYLYNKWTRAPGDTAWQCIPNVRANCWRFDPGIPTCPNSSTGKPCDAWPKISNNMMDYNEHVPHAVTECQIALMNADLSGPGNMFVHSCHGCMPSVAFFQLPKVHYLCPAQGAAEAFYLNGMASFNEDKWLIDICEVNPSNPSVCIGNNINTGWNTGEVGNIDLVSFYDFQVNKHYRVKLIVNNSECPPSSEYSRVVAIKDCLEPDNPPQESLIEFAATNPFNDQLVVFYTVHRRGILQMRLLDIHTGVATTLLTSSEVAPGEYHLSKETGAMPSGSYAIQAIFNNHIFSKIAIKP